MTKRSQRKRSNRRAAATKLQKPASEGTPVTARPAPRRPKPRSSPRWLYVGAAIVVVALVLIWLFATPWSPLSKEGEVQTSWSEPPAMSIDSSKSYFATIKTELGTVRAELFADKAPRTVNNFVFLARQGYYDDTTFHRVIPGFMAQAGDPTGTGTGGPGYTFDDEFHPDLVHDSVGILSMANRGENTNGGQFFIIYEPQSHLDGQHAVFGKVVSGMDVLESLQVRSPDDGEALPGTKILSIEIEES